MCPVCITTAALMASGAGSLGSLTLLVMKRIRANTDRQPDSQTPTTQAKETDQCLVSYRATNGLPHASNS
jgi:hypothetical protein